MDQSNLINSIALVIILLGFVAGAFFLRRQTRVFKDSRQFSIPDSMPSTGVEVPVIGSYNGIKNYIYLTIGENTFNPKLTLYDDYLEYKVFVLRNVDYSQIESVQEFSFLFNNYLKFDFRDRFLSFNVRLANSEIMHKISDFFLARGIPVKISRR